MLPSGLVVFDVDGTLPRGPITRTQAVAALLLPTDLQVAELVYLYRPARQHNSR